MKKIIFGTFLVLGMSSYANNDSAGLLAIPTYTQVNQIGGGLFGYKIVKTTDDTNGNNITVCQNPGTLRCRIKSTALVVGSKGNLTQEAAEEIEESIREMVTPEKLSGTFVFEETFFVKYEYVVEKHALSYTVFNKEEAKANGFSF